MAKRPWPLAVSFTCRFLYIQVLRRLNVKFFPFRGRTPLEANCSSDYRGITTSFVLELILYPVLFELSMVQHCSSNDERKAKEPQNATVLLPVRSF